MKHGTAQQGLAHVVEGRLESLQEVVDVLAGCRDLGITEVAACVRDRRDALLAPLLLDNAPRLHVIEETDFVAAMCAAARLIRRRRDGAVTVVGRIAARSGNQARLCVLAAVGPAESRGAFCNRLAGALWHADVAVVALDPPWKTGPAISPAADGRAALEELRRCGADWLMTLGPHDHVGTGFGSLFDALAGLGTDVEAAMVPSTVIADGSLSGVWLYDPGHACLRRGAAERLLATRPDDLDIQTGHLAPAQPSPKRLLASPSPVLMRLSLALPGPDALIERATSDGAMALCRAVVLPLVARSGRLGHVMLEEAPQALRALSEQTDGALPPGLAAVLQEAEALLENVDNWNAILAGEADGLVHLPHLAIDAPAYLIANPDLFLDIARGGDSDVVRHMLGVGIIEGRAAPRRLAHGCSTDVDRAAFALLGMADAASVPSRSPVSARTVGRLAALWDEGRLAAVFKQAHKEGDRLAALTALARLGSAAAVAKLLADKASQTGTDGIGDQEAGLLFDVALPAATPFRPEPDIIMTLYSRDPHRFGLRAVDFALHRGDFALARRRMVQIKASCSIDPASWAQRTWAVADWTGLLAYARRKGPPSEDKVRDSIFGLAYLGRLAELDAFCARTTFDPATTLFFRGVVHFMCGDGARAYEAIEQSARVKALPNIFHLLIGMTAQAGDEALSDEYFRLLAFADGAGDHSRITLAHYMERIGQPEFAIQLMRSAIRSGSCHSWLRIVGIFYLFRLLNFARRSEEAAAAAIAVRAHEGVGAASHDAEYRQTLVSISVFMPWLTPAMKSKTFPINVPSAPVDLGIDDAVAIVTGNPGHRVCFVGFQNGDTYLFLYVLAGLRDQWRAEGEDYPLIIVTPARLAGVVGLFKDLADSVTISEVRDFYRLKQRLHDLGLEQRAIIGHYEFLQFAHDGRNKPAPRTMHYVPSIKSAMGYAADYAGHHPEASLPVPARGPRPRALLSPHANSMPALPDKVWRALARELDASGYEVFINRGPGEASLGTSAAEITPGFAELLAFAHGCDLVVGLRSGLLDIVSGSPARMVEIYNAAVYAAPFLHIWELGPLRPGRETRVVRLVENNDTIPNMVAAIMEAAIGA